MTNDFARLPRLIGRAAIDVVSDWIAAFHPTPVGKSYGTWPCGGVEECYCGTEQDVRGKFGGYVGRLSGIEDRDDFAQPVGEVPDLPPYVPGPDAGATVPGGNPPAAGDHYRLCPFCLLPDGHSGRHVAQRTIPAAGDHSTSVLLDLAGLRIGYLAADAGKSSDVLDDFITELHERAEAVRAIEAMPRPLGDMLTDAAVETDQLAALGDPAYLVARANLSDALIAAAALVSRAVPHPADLSGGASKRADSPAKRAP